jgi:hypothetical protein
MNNRVVEDSEIKMSNAAEEVKKSDAKLKIDPKKAVSKP